MHAGGSRMEPNRPRRLCRADAMACPPGRSIWPSPIRRSTSVTTTTSTTTAGTDEYLDWSRHGSSAVYRVLKTVGHVLAGDRRRVCRRTQNCQPGDRLPRRSWVIWYYTFGVNCKNEIQPLPRPPVLLRQRPEEVHLPGRELENRIPSARQLVYADTRANPPAGCRTTRGSCDRKIWPTALLQPKTPGTSRASPARSKSGPDFTAARCRNNCSVASSVLLAEGDLVLDPFSGSATTVAVAKKLGRRYLGFELSTEYAKRGTDRLDVDLCRRSLGRSGRANRHAPPTAAGKIRGQKRRAPAAHDSQSDAAPAISPQQLRLFHDGLLAAYRGCYGGYSLDRVVADPEKNEPAGQRLPIGQPAGRTGNVELDPVPFAQGRAVCRYSDARADGIQLGTMRPLSICQRDRLAAHGRSRLRQPRYDPLQPAPGGNFRRSCASLGTWLQLAGVSLGGAQTAKERQATSLASRPAQRCLPGPGDQARRLEQSQATGIGGRFCRARRRTRDDLCRRGGQHSPATGQTVRPEDQASVAELVGVSDGPVVADHVPPVDAAGASASAGQSPSAVVESARSENCLSEAHVSGFDFRPVATLDEMQAEAINSHLRGYNRAHNAAFFQARDLPENSRRGRSIFLPMTPRKRSWAG